MKRLLFLSILSVFMFACSSDDDENNNNDNKDGFVELSNQEILVDSSPFNEPTYNIINILQNSTPEKEYAEIDNEIVNYLYSSTYEFKADGTFIFTDGFNNEFVTTYSYNESEDEIILADLNDFFVDNFKIIEFYRDYDAENGSDYRFIEFRTEIKLDFEDNTDEDDVIIFVEFRLTDDIYFEPTNPE